MKTIRLKEDDRCLVVSDIHIGNGFSKEDRLLELLDQYDFVVFNGDIFEILIGNPNKIIQGKGAPIVDWMWKNQEKFAYVVGNHDEKLWDIEDELFWPLYDRVQIIQKNKRFVITHGHQFDRLNRHTTWKTKLLWILEYIANKLFKVNWQQLIFKDRKHFYNYADRKRRDTLPGVRANARWSARAAGTKCLIHGHTHFPNVEEIDGIKIIDQGSFVIGISYVEITKGIAELVEE